jgi:hypothetical protein
MKKHLFKITVILICLLGCTACFDLQENLLLKKDGSGKFSFLINLGEFKPMLSMFDQEDNKIDKEKSTTRKSPANKLNSTFEITRRKLLNTPGISNVKNIEDTINYSFGLSFDFKNIEALNKAMNRLFEDDSADTEIEETVYFQLKNNQLTRLEVLDSKSLLGKTNAMSGISKSGKTDNGLMSLSKLFEAVTYTANYEFENKIDSIKNENAMLSSNLKKVSIKCFPFAAPEDSTQQKCSISNIITFK